MTIRAYKDNADGYYQADVPDGQPDPSWVIAKGLTPTAIVPPVPYVKTWQELRQASIADGGYGTIPEQMEMIGEQGIGVFQAHIASVKLTIAKPV